MKIVAMIARILLGAIFVFFGSNLLFHFLHSAMPTGTFGLYMTALFSSHYIIAVGLFQVIGGLLLLVNRYVPLALVILGAIIVNILLVHFLMAPSGIPLALVVMLLWLLVYWRHRTAFAGIYTPKMDD